MLGAEAREPRTPDLRAHHQTHGADAVERRLLHAWGKGRCHVQGLPAPFLFLKRLSDVFYDEIGRLAVDYGDREFPLSKRAPLGVCFRGGAFRLQRQHPV